MVPNPKNLLLPVEDKVNSVTSMSLILAFKAEESISLKVVSMLASDILFTSAQIKVLFSHMVREKKKWFSA